MFPVRNSKGTWCITTHARTMNEWCTCVQTHPHCDTYALSCDTKFWLINKDLRGSITICLTMVNTYMQQLIHFPSQNNFTFQILFCPPQKKQKQKKTTTTTLKQTKGQQQQQKTETKINVKHSHPNSSFQTVLACTADISNAWLCGFSRKWGSLSHWRGRQFSMRPQV